MMTSLGVVSGLLVWGGASAVGVAVVLEANAFAFMILKLAGAAYLGFLGIRALVSVARRASGKIQVPGNRLSIPGRVNSPYFQGLFNNIPNPKIAIFFTSLLPQFITPSSSVLLDSLELAGLFATIGLWWLAFFSLAMSTAGSLLRLPKVKDALDAITGVVLIGLGVKVATDTR